MNSPSVPKGGGRKWSFSHFLLNVVLGACIVVSGPLLEAMVPHRYLGQIVALLRFPFGAFACGWWLPRGIPGATCGAALMARVLFDSPDSLAGGATAKALAGGFTALLPYLMLCFELWGWFGRRIADKSAEEGSQ